MMTRAEKDAVISDLKVKIESAKALFVTNLVGIASNDAVGIRKAVRVAKGTVVVTKNSLFGQAAQGTYAEKVLGSLKGTNAVAFAFEDAQGVAKAIYDASKELEPVTVGAGYLGQQQLSVQEVTAIAQLPSRDQMLGTLLATFNAPVSAFARLMNAVKDECEKQGVQSASGLKKETAVEA